MIRLENVLKISLQDVLKTFWRHLQSVLKTSWRCFEDVFARRMEDVLKTSWGRIGKTSWRRLENFLKTSWRCMAKANIFVLIKTSWRRLQDVFWRRRRKMSSRRLHQDELLLGKLYQNFSKIFFKKLSKKIERTVKTFYGRL